MAFWALALGMLASSHAGEPRRVMLVLDTSGSMAAGGWSGCIGRRCPPGSRASTATKHVTRLDHARALVRQLASDFAGKGADAGLMAFGGTCKHTEMLVDFGFGRNAPSRISTALGSLFPAGATPLALAIKRAGDLLVKRGAERGEVVVATDGFDTCDGDPAGVAKKLNIKHGIRVSLVGIGIDDYTERQLRTVSEAGGGWFRREGDAFTQGIVPEEPVEPGGATEVKFSKDPPPPPPPPPPPVPKKAEETQVGPLL